MNSTIHRPRVFLAFLFLSTVVFSLTTPAGKFVPLHHFLALIVANLSFVVAAFVNVWRLKIFWWQRFLVEAMGLCTLSLGLYFYSPVSFWLFVTQYVLYTLLFEIYEKKVQLVLLFLSGIFLFCVVGFLQRDISYLLANLYLCFLCGCFLVFSFGSPFKLSLIEFVGPFVFIFIPFLIKTSSAFSVYLYPLVAIHFALLFLARNKPWLEIFRNRIFYSLILTGLAFDHWFQYW